VVPVTNSMAEPIPGNAIRKPPPTRRRCLEVHAVNPEDRRSN